MISVYIELAVVLLVFFLSIIFVLKTTNNKNRNNSQIRLKFNFTDFVIIAIFTIINSALLFYQLGSHQTKSVWFGDFSGKTISLKFAKPTQVKELSFWGCIANGVIDFSYGNKLGETVKFATIDNQHVSIVKCDWHTIPINTASTIESITMTIVKPLVTINRLIVQDKANQNIHKFIPQAMIDPKLDNMAGIFYNSESLPPNIAHNATFFDENAYVLPAYHYLYQHSFDVNLVHPQLGPLLIGVGIKVFGMNPFGWRFIVSLCGVLLIPLIYFFARSLFYSRRAGFFAAFLLTFEFMHFSISRVAIIEPIVTLLLVAEYFSLWQYLKKRSYSFAGGWFLLAGICFGLALSVKWSALFSLVAVLPTITIAEYRMSKTELGFRFGRVLILLAIVWMIIPVSIYILSYAPYFFMIKQPFFPMILALQKFMLLVHTKLAVFSDAPNVPWWSWPLDLHPLSIFFWFNPVNMASNSIVLLANPAITWFGIITILIFTYKSFTNPNTTIWFIVLIVASQFLPYALMTRTQYMYYYYSALPLMILSIVGLLNGFFARRDRILIVLSIGYLLIVASLFIVFYPALSGINIPRTYVFKYLLWFNGWFF